jgi:drug/metabolite transporter (DMT)-like permease
MTWLILTILAYFFLAIVVLFDRYFLVGKIPNPKVYTFNVGILWFLLCLLLIPFGITIPGISLMILGLGAGLVRILAILFLTESIIRGEVSRAVPTIGGLLPVFSFFLFFLYFPRSEILNLSQLLAFVLLVLGSVMISLKKFSLKIFTFENLKYPITSAFLFALNFFLMKILFLKIDFLTGFFLTLVGGGLGAIFFLIFSQTRESIFAQKVAPKISGFFILGQILGGLGVFSQFYAVSLVKPGQVPLINALEGIRYVFLLFFVFILSFWKPELLKEEMKGTILLQKIAAVLLISLGLLFLFLK